MSESAPEPVTTEITEQTIEVSPAPDDEQAPTGYIERETQDDRGDDDPCE